MQWLYKLYDEKQHTIKEICKLLGISKQTLYDYLDRRKNEKQQQQQTVS